MESDRAYLLDTQVALRFFTKTASSEFVSRYLQGETNVGFHQVSTWEVQIKYSLGKLPLPEKPEAFLRRAVEESGLDYLPIEDEAIFFLDRLPPIHRDPFDRLLIAHAIVSGRTIISSDRVFERYPVKLEIV